MSKGQQYRPDATLLGVSSGYFGRSDPFEEGRKPDGRRSFSELKVRENEPNITKLYSLRNVRFAESPSAGGLSRSGRSTALIALDVEHLKLVDEVTEDDGAFSGHCLFGSDRTLCM
jgi:hypothetical protein